MAHPRGTQRTERVPSPPSCGGSGVASAWSPTAFLYASRPSFLSTPRFTPPRLDSASSRLRPGLALAWCQLGSLVPSFLFLAPLSSLAPALLRVPSAWSPASARPRFAHLLFIQKNAQHRADHIRIPKLHLPSPNIAQHRTDHIRPPSHDLDLSRGRLGLCFGLVPTLRTLSFSKHCTTSDRSDQIPISSLMI